jgi:hypothetical protein
MSEYQIIGCPCAYCWNGWAEPTLKLSVPFGTVSLHVYPEGFQPMVAPHNRYEYGVCLTCGSSHAHESDLSIEEP